MVVKRVERIEWAISLDSMIQKVKVFRQKMLYVKNCIQFLYLKAKVLKKMNSIGELRFPLINIDILAFINAFN